jgi:zinc transport system substrate-binding protein
MVYKMLIGCVLLATAILLLFFGTKRKTTTPTSSIPVVVTFYPLAEFTRQVGGDLVTVRNLTPAGTEPHDFDPSPKDLVAIQTAKLFVYNGAGIEVWLDKATNDIQKKTTLVETVAGIDLLGGQDDTRHDPHVWLDPLLAAQQVENIKNGLIAVDPTHAAVYTENATKYQQQLSVLDSDFREGLSTCKSRSIVTSHNAFAYVAKRYDLTVKSISGLSPDEEPSPKKLAEVVQFTKTNEVKYIFFETLVSPKLAETIAQETGAQILVFNPLEGLTEEEEVAGKNYISVQRENLEALHTALGCK